VGIGERSKKFFEHGEMEGIGWMRPAEGDDGVVEDNVKFFFCFVPFSFLIITGKKIRRGGKKKIGREKENKKERVSQTFHPLIHEEKLFYQTFLKNDFSFVTKSASPTQPQPELAQPQPQLTRSGFIPSLTPDPTPSRPGSQDAQDHA
jgi:hypothetical protein